MLALALQQGLVGGILDQGVFEGTFGIGQNPALVQDFRRDGLTLRRDRLQARPSCSGYSAVRGSAVSELGGGDDLWHERLPAFTTEFCRERVLKVAASTPIGQPGATLGTELHPRLICKAATRTLHTFVAL